MSASEASLDSPRTYTGRQYGPGGEKGPYLVVLCVIDHGGGEASEEALSALGSDGG